MSPLLLLSNTNQYNINASLCTNTDVLHTDMLQPHFISCRGVSGAGGNMRRSRNFCQFHLVLSLFYSLQRGPNGNYTCTYTLPRIQRGSIIFQGGVQLFPGGGVQMLISIETHICTCYFPGGGVRTPYPPLDPHMGIVIITG